MRKYIPDDRVYHISDPHCTGTVIATEHGGAGRYLVTVDWDYTPDYASNPSTWYEEDLRLNSRPGYIIPPKVIQPREQNMSQALWCDKGGHAFSAKDPDREHYTSTRNVTNGNITTQMTAELDICGPCTKDVVLFEPPQITSGTPVQDSVPPQVQS